MCRSLNPQHQKRQKDSRSPKPVGICVALGRAKRLGLRLSFYVLLPLLSRRLSAIDSFNHTRTEPLELLFDRAAAECKQAEGRVPVETPGYCRLSLRALSLQILLALELQLCVNVRNCAAES